jgi:error-prone DNA polymerase
MPDPPHPKARAVTFPDVPSGNAAVRHYAELHCKTNYSFLEGASHPDELMAQAAALGYAALAITDRHSLAGVVRAHVAAKAVGLPLIVGAEVTPQDSSILLIWPQHRAGYGRLCRLLTRGRRQSPKGECRLTVADVAEHSDGCLVGLVLQPTALDKQLDELHRWRSVCGDRLYAVAELHRGPQDPEHLAQMQHTARAARVPLVAANDVHYHVPERRFLQDVLTAIRYGCTVAELGARRFPNSERSLKPLDDLQTQFATAPDALARTLEIADRCRFSLDELRYDYPEELCPPGETTASYLARLTWAGAHNRYPHGIPAHVEQLLHHELRLIGELHYEAYFLTVWDLVQFARSRGILCQGRGSAANSAVCYCLGVTAVDPDRISVLFERFISKERGEAPDIDIDFEHERREEVLQYVYEKYGRDRAGMTGVVITYRPRSAVRDVGKALGLSLDRVDTLAKAIDHHHDDSSRLIARFQETGFDVRSRLGRQLIHLVRELLGFPRHLSQHVGGMVLTHRPLCELVPIENASMPGRTVVQWDKDDLDALGILKVDCLALGMLTALRRGLDLIHKHSGQEFTLATIPAEDPAVYEMACRADTMGVFQIESRAQMSMLPRLRPKEFYDLVVEVAIVRPGPIQGGIVHPYIRRRQKLEPVEYPSPQVEEVLKGTLGVVIFQEQAMKLAMVAAGFTAGEADQLRRAMAAWRRKGALDQFRQKLIDGMQSRGYTLDFAERLFNQIKGFGEYGFPESHAASFALLVYASAWLKCHYPAAFLAALLNSQPMGFYAPAQLVADARKHGVEVRPVCINASDVECTLEADISGPLSISMEEKVGVNASGPLSPIPMGERVRVRGSLCPLPPKTTGEGTGSWAVRLGWNSVRGLSAAQAQQIVAARGMKPYVSVADFLRRTHFRGTALSLLARADAFHALGTTRREVLWHALGSPGMAIPGSLLHPQQLTLFDEVDDEPAVPLPALPRWEEVTEDYRACGLSLRDHPFRFLRARLDKRGVTPSRQLADCEADRRYKVAGIVLLRQRPGTAKGITFMTLEDETGLTNLIVQQAVWERFHHVARRAVAMLATGMLQRQDGIIHLLVDRLDDLSALIANFADHSRNFR